MNITQAAEHLQKGGLLVFPTETVYGLGAVFDNIESVQKIYSTKGRPQKNPLILHIASVDQLREYVLEIPAKAQKLIDSFWPGPLTICFKKSHLVPDIISAGLNTICVRTPSLGVTQELLKKVGKAVAAPSANISGKPSTTSHRDAVSQLREKGVEFLEGESSPLGLESTIIDCTQDPPTLLRPGSISREQMEAVIGPIQTHNHNEIVSSPGQLLEHYAPQQPLTVICGSQENRRKWLTENSNPNSSAYGFIGSLKNLKAAASMQICEQENDLEQYARNLYHFLNWCDRQDVAHIYLELPHLPSHPLYEAVFNRLEKASRGSIIER